jgi:hypothetical protein
VAGLSAKFRLFSLEGSSSHLQLSSLVWVERCSLLLGWYTSKTWRIKGNLTNIWSLPTLFHCFSFWIFLSSSSQSLFPF